MATPTDDLLDDIMSIIRPDENANQTSSQSDVVVTSQQCAIPTHWPSELKEKISGAKIPQANSHSLRITDFNSNLRFRYKEEIKQGAKKKKKDTASIEANGFRGDVCVICELLTDENLKRPMINTMYIGSKEAAPQWKIDCGGSVMYQFLQYDGKFDVKIPSVGIIRKKECHLPKEYVKKMKTSSVVFKFHMIQMDSLLYAEVESQVVKCSHLAPNNGKLSIIHVNPKSCHAYAQIEVTVIGENMNENCSILVTEINSCDKDRSGRCDEERNFREEIPYHKYTFRHKQNSAYVFMMPRYPFPQGGQVQVKLKNNKTGEVSEDPEVCTTFTYTPDPSVDLNSSILDRPAQLRQLTTADHNLVRDSMAEACQPSTSGTSTVAQDSAVLSTFTQTYHNGLANILKKISKGDLLKLATHLRVKNPLLQKANHGVHLELLKTCTKSKVSREEFRLAASECGLEQVVNFIDGLPQ